MHSGPVTQTSLFTPAASAIKSELAVSLAGLTLDELAQMLRAHGLVARVVYSDQSDVASFRTSVQAALSEALTVDALTKSTTDGSAR